MKKILLFTSFSICFVLTGQNLLQEDFDNWTEGREMTSGFYNMGDYEENIREYGENPTGTRTLLWKATPVLGDDNNGGFYTAFHPVEHLREYRFSVWFKKTGTSSGRSYMGSYAYNDRIKTLEGTIDNNSLFMNYKIADLDQWFLAVAYIRPSTHTGTENKGRLYNTAGEEIGVLKDYKFADNAVACMLKAFLFYDTTVTNSQFLYAPRMEQVNGLEPSIEELLNIGVPTQLTFLYDRAGNQKLRTTPSSVPQDPAMANKETIPMVSGPQISTTDELLVGEPTTNTILEALSESISISPNPTTRSVSIYWDKEFTNMVTEVVATDFSGKSVPVDFVPGTSEAQIDLANYPTGIYLVRFLLNNGRQIEKKIIKK